MPHKDPERRRENQRERSRRYRERKKVEKYGLEAAGVDMRGRHGNHATGPAVLPDTPEPGHDFTEMELVPLTAPSDGQDIAERFTDLAAQPDVMHPDDSWRFDGYSAEDAYRAGLEDGESRLAREWLNEVVRLRAALTRWQGPWRAGYPMKGAHLRPSDGEPCDYVGLPCNKCGRAALSEQEPTPESLREWAAWFDHPGNPLVVVEALRPGTFTAGQLLRRIAAEFARTQSPKEGDDA